jgi:hypothetical protein
VAKTRRVKINRDAADGTCPFKEVFSGFEKLDAVKEVFGSEADSILSDLEVDLNSPRGYMRIDQETGRVVVSPAYLRSGEERHIYLDVIHELVHIRQLREGKELYDRRYAYFERPTEVEAYEVAVKEARRIGMTDREIVEYLRVEWVTEDEFQKFVRAFRLGSTK